MNKIHAAILTLILLAISACSTAPRIHSKVIHADGPKVQAIDLNVDVADNTGFPYNVREYREALIHHLPKIFVKNGFQVRHVVNGQELELLQNQLKTYTLDPSIKPSHLLTLQAKQYAVRTETRGSGLSEKFYLANFDITLEETLGGRIVWSATTWVDLDNRYTSQNVERFGGSLLKELTKNSKLAPAVENPVDLSGSEILPRNEQIKVD